MPTAKRASDLKPYWSSECGRAVVYLGDNRTIMPQLESEQFHTVVTDPPYELGFMGRKWDSTGIAYSIPMWQDVIRIAKPGAHLLSFGGTRTWHRIACAVEDAGWHIRDMVMWVYGSGYPKGTNVSKAIDKELGAERGKTRTPMAPESSVWMDKIGATRPWKEEAKRIGYHEHDSDEPITDAAKQWDGWNTCLKPAVEPIILARKPLPGTVAQCVLEHATGAMNVDACRVESPGEPVNTDKPPKQYTSSGSGIYNFNSGTAGTVSMSGGHYGYRRKDGRWPANFIHDGSEEVLSLFLQSQSSSQEMPLPLTPGDSVGQAHGNNGRSTVRGHDDHGSAARYFYTAKANKDDRPHGKGATVHPTVKPLDLMQYLIRLVCVPGGTVLDLFMGSGSTGCAAILEGMRFVGIEQSQEYADIAVGRIKLALAGKPVENTPGLPETYGSTASENRATLPGLKKMRGT